MKFKFTFEKLLRHRKTIEEAARKEFMLARAKVIEAERDLAVMFGGIDQTRAQISQTEVVGGRLAGTLLQLNEFIDGQKYRIIRQREKIRELIAEVERRQQILVEAARGTKTLEKLRVKQFEAFKDLRKKREAKEIDEIVTTRFQRGED